MSAYLDAETWAVVQRSVPVLCVDVVPLRDGAAGLQVGLIRRRFADTGDLVWCHVGGRVRHGETTDEAVRRHVTETFEHADGTDLGTDPQPHHVVQWFPAEVRVGGTYGDDPRKHAVSLCWALRLGEALAVREGGEGAALAWFAADLSDVDDADLWPGTRHLVTATVSGAERAGGLSR